MTADEYRKHLRALIDRKFDGSQHRAAAAWGMSDTYLSETLRGIRKPSAKILQATGHERVVRYCTVERIKA